MCRIFSQRANMEQHKSGKKSVTMSFLSYPTSSDLTLLPCGLTYDRDSDITICENYAVCIHRLVQMSSLILSCISALSINS